MTPQKSLDEASRSRASFRTPGSSHRSFGSRQSGSSTRGDVRGAAKTGEQAAQAAARSQDRTLDIWAQAELARTVGSGAASRVRGRRPAKISRQAEVAGLTYLSLHCALEGAHALL